MRRTPIAAASLGWLFQAAWAVWFGGLVVLGAVSAPGIFRAARSWPDPGSAALVYRFAGIATGAGFRRFNSLALACGVVLLLAGPIVWALDRRAPRLHAVRLGAVAVCLLITRWLSFGVFPEMDRLRLAGEMARFDMLHHAYEHWSIAQVWILLAVGGMSAWLSQMAPWSRPPESDPAAGAPVPALLPPPGGDSGAATARLLAEANVITPEEIATARQEAQRTGLDVGSVLLRQGRITPVQLLQARAHMHGMRAVDVTLVRVEPAAIAAVPARVVRYHNALPLCRQGETLVVAVADPANPLAADAIRSASRLRIQLVLGEESAIKRAIAEHYPA